MLSHRIYKYTSIGRTLDPAVPSNRAVLILLPLAAILGAAVTWSGGGDLSRVLQQAARFLLIVFVAWALARELDPDHGPVAFVGLAVGLVVAMVVPSAGILIAYVTLGLIRIVNRSTGLAANKTDSVALVVLSVLVIYLNQSPAFGVVAALAFILDGSLKEPLRLQWGFALICLGATVVYMVDHHVGLTHIGAPDSLFDWLALLFLTMFGLNMLITRSVRSRSDVHDRPLDANRVRGGMLVALCAALQGIQSPATVAVIVAPIAGVCIGMALRKSFNAPSQA